MRSADNIEKMIKRLHFKAGTEMHDRILIDTLKAREEHKKAKSALIKPNIWRIIMRSRMTKFATAAVIIIAVFICIHYFGGPIDGSTVAWADVVERLEQMSSFTARASRVFTEVGKDEPIFICDVIKYFSPDHGYMEEQYINGELGMIGYGLFSEKLLIIVLPQAKQYYRFKLNEEILSMMEYICPTNPDGIIKLFGSERCTRLGKQKVNGVNAEGFEVKELKVLSWVPRILFQLESIDMRLWVDPETLLPIEVEAEGFIGKGFLTGFKDLTGKEVVYDIEYDVEIDPNIFEPNIPDDYLLIDPADMAEKAMIFGILILPLGTVLWKQSRRKKRK